MPHMYDANQIYREDKFIKLAMRYCLMTQVVALIDVGFSKVEEMSLGKCPNDGMKTLWAKHMPSIFEFCKKVFLINQKAMADFAEDCGVITQEVLFAEIDQQGEISEKIDLSDKRLTEGQIELSVALKNAYNDYKIQQDEIIEPKFNHNYLEKLKLSLAKCRKHRAGFFECYQKALGWYDDDSGVEYLYSSVNMLYPLHAEVPTFFVNAVMQQFLIWAKALDGSVKMVLPRVVDSSNEGFSGLMAPDKELLLKNEHDNWPKDVSYIDPLGGYYLVGTATKRKIFGLRAQFIANIWDLGYKWSTEICLHSDFKRQVIMDK